MAAQKTTAAKKTTAAALPPVPPVPPILPQTTEAPPPAVEAEPALAVAADEQPQDQALVNPVDDTPPAVEMQPHPAVYSLADAQALPELDAEGPEAIGAAAYEAPNERAIQAFKDHDGRTMAVGFTNGRLFKAATAR